MKDKKPRPAPKQPVMAPEGSVVVLGAASGIAVGLDADAARGFATPGHVPLGFAAPGHVALGFAPPGHVVLGFVGPNGVISHLSQAAPRPVRKGKAAKSDGTSITVWQDDPGDPVTVDRPVPNPSDTPAFHFVAKAKTKAPPVGNYEPGTDGFVYWTAVEALRRGAAFWESVIGPFEWHVGPTLPVVLDAGKDFNAYYDRKALNFFKGNTPFGSVHSGESPDILCHEMGHAVLDAIKPQLWNAASLEAAAFHESFGDISALLSALQLKEIREEVLRETNGQLYTSSRLSRLAEQLGAAIRLQNPQAAEPDCLRNAVNSFTYSDPTDLSPTAPASHLSSEPHSFSRLFTGAFFEALAALLTARAADPASPTADELKDTTARLAQLLVAAIDAAPVVSNFLSQIASDIIIASDPATEAPVLRAVFVRRSLLSLHSAMSVVNLNPGEVTKKPRPRKDEALGTISVDASHYGLRKPLRLGGPGQPRAYEVWASAANARSVEPDSAQIAARSFADDTVRRGRVHFTKDAHEQPKLHRPSYFHTHQIVADGGDALKLERLCFDCGLHWG